MKRGVVSLKNSFEGVVRFTYRPLSKSRQILSRIRVIRRAHSGRGAGWSRFPDWPEGRLLLAVLGDGVQKATAPASASSLEADVANSIIIRI